MPEPKAPLNPGSQHTSPVRSSRIRAKVASYGLAEIIKSTPNCFDGVKIALVDRGISEIDMVPRRYQEAKTLFLSNNAIKDLAGISQFPNLQSLSLAYNKVTDYETLDFLSICKNLQTLSLEGNPVTKLPFYRSRVIQLLPTLSILDRQQVTSQEKQAAQKQVDNDSRLMGLLLFCEYNSLSLARYLQFLFSNTEVNNVVGIVKKRKILEAAIELATMPQEIDSKEWVTQTSTVMRGQVAAMMDISTPFQKSTIVLVKYYVQAYVKKIKEGLSKNTEMLLELCEKADFPTRNQCELEIKSLIGKVQSLDENLMLESNSPDSSSVITTLEDLHEEFETDKMKVEKGVNFVKMLNDMEYVLQNLKESDTSINKLTVVQQPPQQMSQQSMSGGNQRMSGNSFARPEDQSILSLNTLRTGDPQLPPVPPTRPQPNNINSNSPHIIDTVPQPSPTRTQYQSFQPQQPQQSRYSAASQSRIPIPQQVQQGRVENAILSSTVEEYQKVAETNAIKALKLEADYKARLQTKEQELSQQESVIGEMLNKNRNLEEQLKRLNQQLREREQDIASIEEDANRLAGEKANVETVNQQLREKEFELLRLQRQREATKILTQMHNKQVLAKGLYAFKLYHDVNRFEAYATQEVMRQRAALLLGFAVNVWRRQLLIKKLTELNTARQANLVKKSALVQWVVFTRVSHFIKENRKLAKQNTLKTIFERWNAGLHKKRKLDKNEKLIKEAKLSSIIESRFNHWKDLTNRFWISKNNYKNNQRIIRADEFRARFLEATTIKVLSLKYEQIQKANFLLHKHLEAKRKKVIGKSLTMLQMAFRLRVQENNRKNVVGEILTKTLRRNTLKTTFQNMKEAHGQRKGLLAQALLFQKGHDSKIKRVVLRTMVDTHKHVLSLSTYDSFAQRLFVVRREALVFRMFLLWKGKLSDHVEQKLEKIKNGKDERKSVLRICVAEWRRFVGTQKSLIIYSQSLRIEQSRRENEANKNTIAEIELARLDTVDKLNGLIQEHSETTVQLKDKLNKVSLLENTMKELVVTNNAYKSESALMKGTIERLKAENTQYRNKLYSIEEAQTAQSATVNTELRVKMKEIDDLKAQIADKNMQIERMEKQLELEREGMKMEIDTIMQSNERLRERAKQALSFQNTMNNIQPGMDNTFGVNNGTYRDNTVTNRNSVVPAPPMIQQQQQQQQVGSLYQTAAAQGVLGDLGGYMGRNRGTTVGGFVEDSGSVYNMPSAIQNTSQLQNIDPSTLMKIGAMESNMNNVILKKNIENSKLKMENEMAKNVILDKIPTVGKTTMLSQDRIPNNESIFDGMTGGSDGILGSIVGDGNLQEIGNEGNGTERNINTNKMYESSIPSDQLSLSSVPSKPMEQSYYNIQTLRPSQLTATMTRAIPPGLVGDNKSRDVFAPQMSAYQTQTNIPMYNTGSTSNNEQSYQAVTRKDLSDFAPQQNGSGSIEDEIAALQKKIMSRLE